MPSIKVLPTSCRLAVFRWLPFLGWPGATRAIGQPWWNGRQIPSCSSCKDRSKFRIIDSLLAQHRVLLS